MKNCFCARKFFHTVVGRSVVADLTVASLCVASDPFGLFTYDPLKSTDDDDDDHEQRTITQRIFPIFPVFSYPNFFAVSYEGDISKD